MIRSGLALLEEESAALTERFKSAVIEQVAIERLHCSEALPAAAPSVCLSEKSKYTHAHSTDLFSVTKGMPIAHFSVLRKIELVKELI